MRKKILAFLTAFLMLLSNITIVNASTGQNPIEIENNVGMGNVSITIIEEQRDAATGKLVPFEQDQTVLPCETISKVVTIKNEGEPAWIRARFVMDSNSKVSLTEEELQVKKGWVRKTDGYYYWTKEVPRDGEVQLLEDFCIPCNWTSAQISKANFSIDIKADAVQTRHFDPDFNSNDPWFGTLIEVSAYNYTRDWVASSGKHSLLFLNGADGFFAQSGDAFDSWDTLMPGDTLTEEMVIGNNYNKTVKLYFRVENEMTPILEKNTSLRIFRGTEPVFNGKFEDAKTEQVLAVMEPGTNFVLKYQMDVPKELGNDFDLEYGRTRWIFRAEVYENVKTGVDNNIMIYCSIAIISAVAVLVLVARKKKKE